MKLNISSTTKTHLTRGVFYVLLLLTGTLLVYSRPAASTKVSPRTLTFAQRVAYQRAVEEVYWHHRIWPKNRSDPKPSLDTVMSRAQLEDKVAGFIRDSLTLEDYRQRPITAEQLQAEIDRMARHTKQPQVLRELFEALGNDPAVIAECLARPVLTERLIAELSMQNQSRGIEPTRTGGFRTMSMVTKLGRVAYSLPKIANSDGPPCTDDTWTATSTTNAPEARTRHTAVWTGSEMIVWGGGSGFMFNTGGRYNPSTDSWAATNTSNAPSMRIGHTAVWSGTEMIVWGGLDDNLNFFNNGGRYNPATNSWTTTNTTNAPNGRASHTAVWTGSEMIVWGGSTGIMPVRLNTGGRYNPNTDSWTVTSITSAPEARSGHTAVWTGSEMIVWGGGGNGVLNTGGRYNPNTDSWTVTSITNAPEARNGHTVVWTGSEMIVWGGADPNYLNTGGRYTPGTDSWVPTSTTNVPDARGNHTAVWTESEMVVWGGGLSPTYFNTGGRYNPGTNGWIGTSTTNAPSPRYDHTAVWTGSEMIVWAGETFNFTRLNSGGRYCAQSGAPTPTPTATTEPTPTPSPAGCSVISSLCGSVVVGTAPTDFTVNLSRPAGGAQGSNFMVNGTPANGATLSNGGTTITFHFNASPVVEGLNTMHIPACAFSCGDPGGCVYEFTCTFTYQPPTPTPRVAPTARVRPTPPPRP